MPAKRKTGVRKTRRIGGKGFTDVMKKIFHFVKDNKLISRGLKLISHPYAQTGSVIADKIGLGKRRVGRPRKVGRPKVKRAPCGTGFKVGRGGMGFRVGQSFPGRGIRVSKSYPAGRGIRGGLKKQTVFP